MSDIAFEEVVFESTKQIKQRFQEQRDERKREREAAKKEPERPRFTPVWEAYWSIKTDTPEKFEAWLRLRPPQEPIFLTEEPHAKKTIQFPIQGFKRAG